MLIVAQTTISLEMIIIYILPILLLLLLKKPIDHQFKKARSRIRMVDLIVPYLMVGIHLISQLIFGISWLPYFLIIIFIMAILLLFYFAYKKGEILYKPFLRSWWRFIFLLSFVAYHGLVVIHIVASL